MICEHEYFEDDYNTELDRCVKCDRIRAVIEGRQPELGPHRCAGHVWRTDATGLIDTCLKCGEERA